MKATRIYSEAVENFTDMSKDRVILDLSWNEWVQLQKIIDAARWPNIHKFDMIGSNFNRRLVKALEEAKVKWV